MISDRELEKKILNVLEEEFELDPEDLKPEANLYEDLGLDSLDAVDMVVALEKAFGMKFTNQEALREVRTIADLFKLLKEIRDANIDAVSKNSSS
ncbi:MAG: acyl carrier protein [Gammaproteobacteria bacterium]|nr:acyl carrier protein [Gammaproteobacteria bacterium]